MADRIVVLSANPGKVRTVVESRLPRPRDYRSPDVLRLVDQLHKEFEALRLVDIDTDATLAAVKDFPERGDAAVTGLDAVGCQTAHGIAGLGMLHLDDVRAPVG